MKISKKDALMWFEFFAALPEDEEILPHQQEIVYAAFSQIEDAIDARNEVRRKHAEKQRGGEHYGEEE